MNRLRLFSSAALILTLSALAGCATGSSAAEPGSATNALRDCLASCAADPDLAGKSMCGTDGVTYSSCTWHCANVPAGVGVVPGTCGANGAPPADGPPRFADGVSTCDWRKVDGAWIATACASAIKTPPVQQLPAPIAKREPKAPKPLPAEVDHRARFGLAKNQGIAPACTAFATTAALEGAIRASFGEMTVLSEMHLWSRYAQGSGGLSAGAALTAGTATDDTATAAGLPYDAKLALAWDSGDEEPDEDLVEQLDDATRFMVTGVDVLTNEQGVDGVVERIQRALAAGHDVNVGLIESDEWTLPNADGIIEDHEFGERNGHAILFVGYKTINGRPYFLLRNSWGRGWGLQGYAYLSFDAAAKNVMWATVTHVARRGFAEAQTCAAGQGADLDNVCRVRCANGSLAGADGLCDHPLPVCTDDQVRDASGVCVAKCEEGTSSGDGWSVTCDGATCTFTVDAGQTGCADDGKGTACTKVCPAPMCELAGAPDEFGRIRLMCSTPDL